MSSPVHSDTSSSSGDESAPPAAASVLQTVNIRSHVPILLDLDESNYGQWRCSFDSVLGKFGIADHVRASPPLADRDAEWRQIDHCVVNWLHNSVATNVFNVIYKPRASAFTVWSDIEGLFRDNELHCAVYIEAEFRSLHQGDMTMTQYTSRLKQLADNLRDVGQPVSESSQVLNLLRGLNPKYRYVKPVVSSKFPPHTFLSARSFLLLEEIQLEHDAKSEAGQALYAGHGGSGHGGASGSGIGNTTSRPKNKFKKRGGGGRGGTDATSGGASLGGAGGGGHLPRPPVGYNPWTGLVQAWSMPFRAPGAGVLGPRPPFQAQQAMTAQHQLQLPALVDANSGCWDNSALYSALQSAGVATQPPPSASEWYLDTGASTHMSSAPGSSNAHGEAPL